MVVGNVISSAFAEVRAWESTVSISKFRLHTLNKLSTVGNTISSHKDELIYHYKLNENYTSGSSESGGSSSPITIKDSNPSKIKDYSITLSDNVVTGSLLYGVDIIDTNNIFVKTYNDK